MFSIDMEEFRKSPSYPWVVLVLLGVGAFMVNLDTSVVNVALAFIAKDHQVDITAVQWVVTAYILTVVSSVAIIGRLGDLFGRSRVYSIGFIVFIIGSVLSAMSPTINWLIVSRILQGLGGACVPANNMGILTRTFPSHQRGQALGILSSIVAMGALAGPSVGGFLIGIYGWRAIFLVNLPIGILASILFYIILPHKKIAEQKPAFDYFGSFFIIMATVSGIWGISSVSKLGLASPHVWAALIIAAISFVFFARQERRVSFPVVDFDIFHIQTFRLGVISLTASQIMLFMVNLLMPFYFAEVKGLSPTIMGLALTSLPITLIVMAPVSGWLSDRIGPKVPQVAGLLMVGMAMFFLSLLNENSTILDASWRLALLAMGHATFNAPNNSAMMGSVPNKFLGIASSMIATVRKAAQVLGVAIGVVLFDSRRNAILEQWDVPSQVQQTDAFLAGFSFAFRVGMIITLAAVTVIIASNRTAKKHDEPSRFN